MTISQRAVNKTVLNTDLGVKVPLGREGPGCVAAREDKSGTKGTKTLICPRFYIIPTDYCVRVCVCVAKSHAYDN